jgi:hypothetical protein
MARDLSLRMPSWSQRARAPTATAALAASGVCSGRRSTSTRSIAPGRLPAFYWDHFLIQAGTGLRSGELLDLRRRRVFPELGRIEVIEVRYEAGRFGRGFKADCGGSTRPRSRRPGPTSPI